MQFNKMAALYEPSIQLLSLINNVNGGITRPLTKRYQQWLDVCSYIENNGFTGLILAHENRYQWAIITENPSNSDKVFRYALFDRKGLFGHGEFGTPEGATKAVFDIGYRRLETRLLFDDIAQLWIQ